MVSIEYGYDCSSNRTFAYDARFQNGWPMNHAYTNDPLNRLTAAMRNTRANLTGGTPTNGPDNTIGWDGYIVNPATAGYLVRHRTYLPPLGRWGERDPIGYADALNLFQTVGSRPIKFVDPQGLQASPPLGGNHGGSGTT